MSYPYELDDVSCFTKVARTGSMTLASSMYNIPKATLSHHIRRLEDALQVELFTRKAKGLELTDAGREYLVHCTSIFASCEAAANAAQRAHSTLSGRVRLASGAEFGTAIIGAAAQYISTLSPDLDFDLQLYPHHRIPGGQIDFDCMIYVGEMPDSSLLRRKMGSMTRGLYASPAYLERYGMPATPAAIVDLPGVRLFRNGIPEEWLVANGKDPLAVQCRPRFTVDEYWMAKYFAVSGSAISYLPDFFVHYEVQQKALIPVLPEWRSSEIGIYVMYPSQRHKNPRVMNLVEKLQTHFKRFIRYPGYSLVSEQHGRGSKRAAGAAVQDFTDDSVDT